MGVPVTFLAKHNPDQFEVVGIRSAIFCLKTTKGPQASRVISKCGRANENGRPNSSSATRENFNMKVDSEAGNRPRPCEKATGTTVRAVCSGTAESWTSGHRTSANSSIKPKERNAVIASILKGFPLNVMYWSDREDDTFEIIDGQQTNHLHRPVCRRRFLASRSGTSTICPLSDTANRILDYKLMVYVCTGTDSEKTGVVQDRSTLRAKQLTQQEVAERCLRWVRG